MNQANRGAAMEHRKALAVAGGVALLSLSGSLAVGATAGLLGFTVPKQLGRVGSFVPTSVATGPLAATPPRFTPPATTPPPPPWSSAPGPAPQPPPSSSPPATPPTAAPAPAPAPQPAPSTTTTTAAPAPSTTTTSTTAPQDSSPADD